MINIGIIGLGEMGFSFSERLICSKTITPEQLYIFNRSPGPVAALKNIYPAVTEVSSVSDVFDKCRIVFSAVSTKAQPDILKAAGSQNAHFVSLSNGLDLQTIKMVYNGPVSRIMPTLLMKIGRGIILVCHEPGLDPVKADGLTMLLDKMSGISIVPEDEMDILTELSSCGPGLLSALFQEFVRAAGKHSSSGKDLLTRILLESIEGTRLLLHESGMDFGELIGKVATPGGTTEIGVRHLQAELPSVFGKLLDESMRHNQNRTMQLKKSIQEVL